MNESIVYKIYNADNKEFQEIIWRNFKNKKIEIYRMDSISHINENVIKNVISKINIESYYKY